MGIVITCSPTGAENQGIGAKLWIFLSLHVEGGNLL